MSSPSISAGQSRVPRPIIQCREPSFSDSDAHVHGTFRDFLPSVAAILGALLALWATGVQFSVYSRYALAMLAPLTTAMSFAADGSHRARMLLPLLGALTMLPLAFVGGAGAVGARTFAVALAGGFSAYAIAVLGTRASS